MPQVIFPSGYQVEINHLRQQLDQAHFAYWVQWKQHRPEFKIENIRFRHVPGWDRKVFSIQSAHNGGHWIWKATRVILGMGGMV